MPRPLGDGKTDDTAALLRAIAELTEGGQPGVLAMEPGTYVLTAMINISAPIVLRGAGLDATTLLFPKSLSEVLRRGTDIRCMTSDLGRRRLTAVFCMNSVEGLSWCC